MKFTTIFKFMIAGSVVMFTACGGGETPTQDTETQTETPAAAVEEAAPEVEEYNMGIGPVTERLELGDLDAALATNGETVFAEKCTACHKMGERHVGPALDDVTGRRTPEWIMNMILNPDEMTKKDPIAYDLIAEYIAPMANQSLSLEESRALLEYFRSVDGI